MEELYGEGDLFDVNKHQFGMAYTVPHSKGAVYIYDLSRSGASGYGIPVNGSIGRCKPVLCINLEAARRAPEYDLISTDKSQRADSGDVL